MATLRDNGWISDAVGPSDDILKTIYNEYSITRPRSRNAASARAELPQNWGERSVNCIYYAPAVSNQEAETSERRFVAKVEITYDPGKTYSNTCKLGHLIHNCTVFPFLQTTKSSHSTTLSSLKTQTKCQFVILKVIIVLPCDRPIQSDDLLLLFFYCTFFF